MLSVCWHPRMGIGSLSRILLGAAFGLVAFAPFAQASIVTVTLNGTFYNVGNGFQSVITDGTTTYSATLQYNDSVTGPNNFTPSAGDIGLSISSI